MESAICSFAQQNKPFVLESAAFDPRWGRYSIFGCDPADEVVVGEAERGEWVERLRQALSRWPSVAPSSPLPFHGGWVGFISYEAGAALEGVQPSGPREIEIPAVRFTLYDSALVCDHATGQWYTVVVDWPDSTEISHRRPSLHERQRQLMECLHGTAQSNATESFESSEPDTTSMTVDEYCRRVERVKDYITAGDIYQVNLTQRFSTRTALSPLELYLHLRRTNPAPFAAFLPYGPQAIISSSPELFLEVRGDKVVTRPIKGTRPRTGDTMLDAQRRRELETSEKERAELNMIVDLLRNDLGRVCRYGSIRVESVGTMEEHPTVFHRVATVIGELRPEHTALDLLAAASPGGSVTGCPKIRAMQIIDELEPVRRNVYCGTIGYLGLDGSMSMAIAIRTLVYDRGRVDFHAGSAIVAESEPESEYEEILAKARGMLRALEYSPSEVRRRDDRALTALPGMNSGARSEASL